MGREGLMLTYYQVVEKNSADILLIQSQQQKRWKARNIFKVNKKDMDDK